VCSLCLRPRSSLTTSSLPCIAFLTAVIDFPHGFSAPGAPRPPDFLPPGSVIVVRASHPPVLLYPYPSYQFLRVDRADVACDLLSAFAANGIPAGFQVLLSESVVQSFYLTAAAPYPNPQPSVSARSAHSFPQISVPAHVSATTPSLFSSAILRHLSPSGGNAYSRLADSIQAQLAQFPSRQGQSLSNRSVSQAFGSFSHVLPPTQHKVLATHSAVPVPPSGCTFTDEHIMALISNARQVPHQPSEPYQYSSSHSLPPPSLPSLPTVVQVGGSLYHSTSSLPVPHSSQASTVPLLPSVHNGSSHSTVAYHSSWSH
jgi:hypothetical protein